MFATVAARIAPHHLTPASGRQDHTASPSAPVSFVVRYRSRPSHPAPTCLDVHDTPLQAARDGWAYRGVSGQTRSTLFLQPGLDMLICPSGTALRCFARRATPTTAVVRAAWRWSLDLSFRGAPLGASPESITTELRLARDGAAVMFNINIGGYGFRARAPRVPE